MSLSSDQNLKAAALVSFLQGATHRQIAVALSKSKSTITRWSVKYCWLERRNEAYNMAVNETLLAKTDEVNQNVADNFSALDILLKSATAELLAYQKGKLSRKQLKFTIADIAKLTVAVSNLNNASYQVRVTRNEKK